MAEGISTDLICTKNVTSFNKVRGSTEKKKKNEVEVINEVEVEN